MNLGGRFWVFVVTKRVISVSGWKADAANSILD